MIKGCDFVNAKDSAGNTILHIAILYEHFQIARHVLTMETAEGKKTKDMSATNGCCTRTPKSLQKIAHVLGMGTNEEKETIDVNAINASGHTAMDVILSLESDKKEADHIKDEASHIKDLLQKADAKTGDRSRSWRLADE